MLTTLVISCCLVFIFLQLTNPYISLAKNAIKHTTTETYLIWLLVAFLPLWYNGRRYHPYTGTERGCATMSIFSSFLLSVLASVVAYYICKWLDGDK